MTAQRLVLAGGIWACSWCAAELAEYGITHRGDCTWIAGMRAAERERCAQLAEAEAVKWTGAITGAALKHLAALLREAP